MEWLEKLTDWLKRQLAELMDALFRFLGDLFWIWVEHTLEMFLFVMSKIPVPEFMQQYDINSLLSQGGPTVLWLVGIMQIGPAMAALGVAVVFYIVRRVSTIGIW